MLYIYKNWKTEWKKRIEEKFIEDSTSPPSGP